MKCPGQDTRYWTKKAIFEVKCPQCGHGVEFFKDDTARKCPNCGHRFANPEMDFGCAAYCPYAEQCVGELPEEAKALRADLLKDKVAVEMKRYFRKDFRRIGHASRVARYAEQIGKKEGGNLSVILSAAYLHDIGIHEAERKYNSTAAKYQELEGPPIARGILEKLKAPEALVEEVVDIVGHHHHPRKTETVNFSAVYDADRIVNIEDLHKEKPLTKNRLTDLGQKGFLSESGQNLGREVFGALGSGA